MCSERMLSGSWCHRGCVFFGRLAGLLVYLRSYSSVWTGLEASDGPHYPEVPNDSPEPAHQNRWCVITKGRRGRGGGWNGVSPSPVGGFILGNHEYFSHICWHHFRFATSQANRASSAPFTMWEFMNIIKQEWICSLKCRLEASGSAK